MRPVDNMQFGYRLVFFSLFIGLAGCGSSQHNFVYSVGQNAEVVYGFQEDSSGALTGVSGSPFSSGGIPTAVAVSPSKLFAYVLSAGGNAVISYNFDKNTGVLTAANAAVATGTTPISLA